MTAFRDKYPLTYRLLKNPYPHLSGELERFVNSPDILEQVVDDLIANEKAPEYLAQLIEAENFKFKVIQTEIPPADKLWKLAVNPALELLYMQWQISDLLTKDLDQAHLKLNPPQPGPEYLLMWREPQSGRFNVKAADDEDLLVLKLVSEELDLRMVAQEDSIKVSQLTSAIDRAVDRGIILKPESKIVRPPGHAPKSIRLSRNFMEAEVFTLQWHITNDCDLHCKHCYDRSRRDAVILEDGLKILDSLYNFCLDKFLDGHVCFSGGNPFMHKDFFKLYRAAADYGFGCSILGNPVSEAQLARLVSIKKPAYFQVSLEGLKAHNDQIRGSGFFDRVLKFLDLLKKYEISSQVMLTLTGRNIGQVLELADVLEGRVDDFVFNRLAQVGEGALLELPGKAEYERFLEDYLDKAAESSVMALKDNLINIVRHRRGEELFGGCTGFGCGAAFNFLALLPDGELHACRKFPSLLGNVNRQSLLEVYDSPLAARYRAGAEACHECELRMNCGACMAVVFGRGGDPFVDGDPHCFK